MRIALLLGLAFSLALCGCPGSDDDDDSTAADDDDDAVGDDDDAVSDDDDAVGDDDDDTVGDDDDTVGDDDDTVGPVDADGDGYDNTVDCDDNDPAINPGVDDIDCDGINNDCDPATADEPDADGDGSSTCDGDCDDTDPAINPSATEDCGDGIDNDCDGDVDGDDADCVVTVSLVDVQASLFTPRCASCHDAGHASGLDLTSGATFAETVNVASGQLPSMFRVTPSDVADSYLYHKLTATQGDVGGSGNTMPASGGALTQQQMDDIYDWIDGGALP